MNLLEEFRADGRELEQSGPNWKCNCPFHSENTASCSVHADHFQCFGCGKKGDCFNYLGYVLNRDPKNPKDFVEILRDACIRTGIPFPESEREKAKEAEKPKTVYTLEKLKECCQFQAESNKEVLTEWNESTNPDTQAVEFIEVRFESTVKKRANGKPAKRFLQCSPKDGGFIFGLNGGKTPLFNRTRIRDNLFIVLVEGAKCMRFLTALGICAVAAAGGSNNPVANVDWNPLRGKKICIWPDNDSNGLEFAAEVKAILESIDCQCHIVSIKDLGLADKDDVVDFYERAPGNDEEKQAAIFDVISKSEPETLESQIADNISGKRFAIRHRCFYALSSTLCFLPGSVTMVCASPGTSKSFLVLQWIWEMFFDGIDSAALALEKDMPFHESRTLAQLSGCAGMMNPEWCLHNADEANRILATFKPDIDSLRKARVIQCPGPEIKVTADYLLAWVESEAKRGRKMLAIDPITKLETGPQFWEEQKHFVRAMVSLVSRTKVRLIIVTHPKKVSAMIGLGEMSGAAAFSENTDTILWLQGHQVQYQKIQNPVSPMDEVSVKFNRTIHILKAKLGPVAKPHVGFWYGGNLKHEEVGFVEPIES